MRLTSLSESTTTSTTCRPSTPQPDATCPPTATCASSSSQSPQSVPSSVRTESRLPFGISFSPAVSLKCGSSNGDNTGCGVSYKAQPNSFGAAFNRAGGGIYAMSRTPDAIKTWFWPVGTAPADVRSGAATVNEATWGKPSAIFPSTNQCSVGAKMAAHQMIINLTLSVTDGVSRVFCARSCRWGSSTDRYSSPPRHCSCGDWAGLQANYAAAGCPGTCADSKFSSTRLTLSQGRADLIAVHLPQTPGTILG